GSLLSARLVADCGRQTIIAERMSEKKNDESMVTLGAIARAVGGRLTGDESWPVSDVTHDSRQARAGCLFVAIEGAQVDAHQFIAQARAQGAVGVMSARERPTNFDGAWLPVQDARTAL